MQRLLCQLQLSNYTPKGTWVLECDSGFQMVMGRVREMLKLNCELQIDILGPRRQQLHTQPEEIVSDVFTSERVNWIEIDLIPNALVTRYDFDFKQISQALKFATPDHQKYDVVYINDPFLLRHYKALFFVEAKYQPKFFVHSHFVDVPSCPKFPAEASLWLGQLEATLRADWNFWQCQSALNEFEREARKVYRDDVVDLIMTKSEPADDGYSISEITSPINENNMRFTKQEWEMKTAGKAVLFFPNRISPSSNDYTNGIKLMFNILPEVRKQRQDFVVVCGNPNQKFSNEELEKHCGKDGYIKLTSDQFNRDEYKFVASNSDVAIGLYNADPYGGTASRECIELGCIPLWLRNFEYSSLVDASHEASFKQYLGKSDLSDLDEKLHHVLDECVFQEDGRRDQMFVKTPRANRRHVNHLRNVVRERCSYERTVPRMLERMQLC